MGAEESVRQREKAVLSGKRNAGVDAGRGPSRLRASGVNSPGAYMVCLVAKQGRAVLRPYKI